MSIIVAKTARKRILCRLAPRNIVSEAIMSSNAYYNDLKGMGSNFEVFSSSEHPLDVHK